jgi:CRP/FNR family cyclic AMP-dependent transcriptional regulator
LFGQAAAPATALRRAGRTIAAMSTPSAAAQLRDRARAPDALERADIPWLQGLEANEEQRALADLKVVKVEPGELLCRVGRPVTYWFGVIDGLLKTSNDTAQGVPITFTGLPPGGWFGEGTVIKREAYRYNIEALRPSTVAGLTVDTFHWLLDRSIPFNRFILQQLNERLGQFMAAREIDRLNDPDARVARSLAALFHPILYPGVGTLLRITQQELGYLVGLSRQRVNEALRALQASGLIRVEYGGVKVMDLERLRAFR